MNEHDPRLKELLKHWRDVEPSPAFAANVWRRIHLTGEAEQSPAWGWLWPQPVRLAAVAVLVGVFAGGLAMALMPSSLTASGPAEFSLFRPGTVAGDYLQLVSGGQ